MSTPSRPQRKRKQAATFDPISPQEERSLMQALRISLRPIPLDASDSEDEVGNDDEDFDEGAPIMILLMKKRRKTIMK